MVGSHSPYGVKAMFELFLGVVQKKTSPVSDTTPSFT